MILAALCCFGTFKCAFYSQTIPEFLPISVCVCWETRYQMRVERFEHGEKQNQKEPVDKIDGLLVFVLLYYISLR
jgi:hypothetical protein